MYLLDGNVQIVQGNTSVRGPQAVVWVDRAASDAPSRSSCVIAYFERSAEGAITLENVAEPLPGDVATAGVAPTSGAGARSPADIESTGPRTIPIPARTTGRLTTPAWFGRFTTRSSVHLKLPQAAITTANPETQSPIVARALAQFSASPSTPAPQSQLASSGATPRAPLPHVDHAVQQAQFAPPPIPGPQLVPTPAVAQPASAFRRVQIFPRSEIGPDAEWLTTTQGENALVITGGVNVVIQGLTVEGLPEAFGPLGDIDIETDRVVIWTRGVDTRSVAQLTQQGDLPLEIYMEGNIVFRQGDRIVYANRMFYDVRRQIGVILDAELLTPLPPLDGYDYQGLVRLRAASLRQLDDSRFVAQDAFVTTSRLEEPSYAFRSDTITFQDIQQPAVDPITGMPIVDPFTGQSEVAHSRLAESRNNVLEIAGVPVFYWPTMATDLKETSYYIDNLRIRNDSIFGFQALLELDAFQLLGMEAPPGVEWDANLDWLSKRGLGFGTGVEYQRDSFFALPGPSNGQLDAWFINDDGLDNLGRDRRNIVPEEKFRGRTFWNHRQHVVGGLLNDWTVQGEFGWISDRTFLEQYYENEWEQNKDQITGVRLKRLFDNQSLSIEANGRINDFFTQTQWLPRADYYMLGQPLFGDQLSFFTHTQAAYANMGIASTPDTAQLAAIFERLPWEEDSAGVRIDGRGERFITRNEIDYPLDLAPFKVVPYALGEFGHWGDDLQGTDIQRTFGQFGLRASIPFWAADPSIRDTLFNLNGLAHKVVFDGELLYADANQSIDEFPLYDELDDDSIEEFRRRMFFSPFGGNLAGQFYVPGSPSFIDPKFDPRYYALRYGLQSWVTSPSAEIADDLMAGRLGMRHRLQTKRGPYGQERIIDWMTFDANTTWFPDDERDNFGQPIGVTDYDFKWHLGDRFSILSDGAAEFFGAGVRTASIGMLLTRPDRGNAYFGFRTIDGVIDSNIVTATINYRMSPKWIGSASTSILLDNPGNVGQSFYFSRLGESLVATIGASFDESKDNVGVSFLIEPRFLPTLSVTRRTGITVPPAGAYGLE